MNELRICVVATLLASVLSPSATAEGNKISIEQIGAGNRVHITQKSSDADESTLLEQNITDGHGNQAVTIQQGKTNITDLTQQGRLNNVLTTGSVHPPGESQYIDKKEYVDEPSGSIIPAPHP